MYHEVTAVNNSREWHSQKGGAMISYDLTVTTDEGLTVDVYTNRKASSNAPMVGERIHGFIDTDDRGNQKLTKTEDPNYQSNRPQSGHSAPRSSQSSSGDSTDGDLQIIRQSSLKAAVQVCIANKVDEIPVSERDIFTMAERFTTWAHTGNRPSNDIHPDEVPV